MKLFTWAEIFCVGWAAFNENCPNMEGVAECETNCESNFIECQLNCGSDVECVSACNRIFVTCEASCPCHDNCFEGQGSADGITSGGSRRDNLWTLCPLNSGQGCPCEQISQYCWYYSPIRFWLVNPKVSSVTNLRQIDYTWSAYGEELNSIQWFRLVSKLDSDWLIERPIEYQIENHKSKIENESRNMCNFVYQGENYLVGGGFEGSTT